MILKYFNSEACLITDETTYWGKDESLWRELTFSMGTESADCVYLFSVYADNSSLHRLDPQNVDHLFMRFYVEGDQGKATVRLEMTKVCNNKDKTDVRVSMTRNINIASCLLNLILV